MTAHRNIKNMINYLKKPEYYFRPGSIFKRMFKKQDGVVDQKTPWGTKIEIDVNETIGNSIYTSRIYDLALSETLWRLIEPGNFVLDIGANIGYTTSLCSYKSGVKGKVWAFEPNPLIRQRLTKNIQNNPNQNIKLFPIGLSDSNKEGFLELPEMFSINNGLAYVATENTKNAVKVELKKLDDLVTGDNPINVIKIDVEGHELSVFKGAQNLFNKKLINNIVYEDDSKFPSDLAKFLLDKGYDIFRIEKGWLNVVLKDPQSVSVTSGWEPVNYVATLEPEFIQKKMKGMFYKCLF